jgi:hypothetical protein
MSNDGLATTPLADDRKNKFQRHREVDDAQRRDTTSHDNLVKQHAQDNERWLKKTFQPTAAGGTRLPDDLAALKKASDADRAARRNQGAATPTTVTSCRSLQALLEFWQRNTDNAVNFYESEFNYTSLTNCLVTLVFGKHRPATVETVAEAYNICIVGNYLELPRRVDGNGATIRKRGDWKPQSIPPTLYPAYVWPAEVEAVTTQERENQMAEWLAGKKLAQARPFSELQAEVRRGYKTPRPGAPNLDRTY